MKKSGTVVFLICGLLLICNTVFAGELLDARFYFDRGNTHYNDGQYDNDCS